jgi:hypothetical protein
VAAYFASRDKMDISVNIAVGSGAQIALFVAPGLVLASFVIGPFPMALVFNGFELCAIFLAIIIADQVTQRGESTWFEGLQLLAIYAVLGLTFFLSGEERMSVEIQNHLAAAIPGEGDHVRGDWPQPEQRALTSRPLALRS